MNPSWPYISDHLHRILIIGGSGSGKTNVLLNLIKNQRPDIDKIYLYAKDLFESKHQLLIKGREKVGIENLKNLKAFIVYSQTIDDVYENLEDYNPTKERKVLTVFDDKIADIEANKKLSCIVTELFLRERKFNILVVFISKSYLRVPKTIRLLRQRKLQQIALNHFSDIEFKDVMKLYKTRETHFLC